REAEGVKEAVAIGEGGSDPASTRAVLFALARRRSDAEKAIETAKSGEGSSHFHHAAYNVATAYALLGRNAEALSWLERGASEGMPCAPLFEKDPFLDPLRADPAFQAFLKRARATTDRLKKVL